MIFYFQLKSLEMGVDLNMRETKNFVGRNSLLSLSPLRNTDK